MTARRSLTAFAPLAIAAAFVVAGCGSSSGVSKNDYVKSINQAVASLQKSTASIGTVDGSGGDAVARLKSGSKAMDAAADDFGKITPPNDATHAHGQIVDGLHKLADTFGDAAKAAGSNDPAKLVALLGELQNSQGARELQAATDELSAKGYKVQ